MRACPARIPGRGDRHPAVRGTGTCAKPRGRFAAAAVAIAFAVCACVPADRDPSPAAERVAIENGGWRLVGDLRVPQAVQPVPGVLLLNKAAGSRVVYAGLADELARRGIASLRVDLRGHGESTNLGRFDPAVGTEILDGTPGDVTAALRFLGDDRRVDATMLGCVGASYSGEMMMESARATRPVAAYAALSPGSLSDSSIAMVDRDGLPFLLVVSRHERWMTGVVQAVRERSHGMQLLELDGTEHATDLLDAHPDLAELVAVWFDRRFARTDGS